MLSKATHKPNQNGQMRPSDPRSLPFLLAFSRPFAAGETARTALLACVEAPSPRSLSAEEARARRRPVQRPRRRLWAGEAVVGAAPGARRADLLRELVLPVTVFIITITFLITSTGTVAIILVNILIAIIIVIIIAIAIITINVDAVVIPVV